MIFNDFNGIIIQENQQSWIGNWCESYREYKTAQQKHKAHTPNKDKHSFIHNL